MSTAQAALSGLLGVIVALGGGGGISAFLKRRTDSRNTEADTSRKLGDWSLAIAEQQREENRELRAQLADAQARLREAEALLQRLKLPPPT